ncbi:hypothetical protein Tco_0806365 [Tanacetum coccineum]
MAKDRFHLGKPFFSVLDFLEEILFDAYEHRIRSCLVAKPFEVRKVVSVRSSNVKFLCGEVLKGVMVSSLNCALGYMETGGYQSALVACYDYMITRELEILRVIL